MDPSFLLFVGDASWSIPRASLGVGVIPLDIGRDPCIGYRQFVVLHNGCSLVLHLFHLLALLVLCLGTELILVNRASGFPLTLGCMILWRADLCLCVVPLPWFPLWPVPPAPRAFGPAASTHQGSLPV
jgi:hypothetical protein